MTRDEMLGTLRRIEHVQDSHADAKFCPECGQNKFAKDGPHDYPCGVAAAIAWLEDENNKELVDDRSNGSESKGVWWGWVLR